MSFHELILVFDREAPTFAKIFEAVKRSLSLRRIVLIVSFVTAIILTLTFNAATDTRGNDDAAISWLYSLNFANGHGLTNNLGEYVEGFSNFLYVLILGVVLVFVPADQVYLVSLTVNIFSWLILLAIFHRFTQERLGRKVSAVATFLLACSPALAFWATSGMETVPAVATQIFLWTQISRFEASNSASFKKSLGWLVVASVFCILMRADGFIWLVMAVAYLLSRREVKKSLWTGAVLLLIMGPYTLWRLWYYGYPLPNTYYAKVSGSLSDRLLNAWSQVPIVFMLTGLTLAVFVLAIAVVSSVGTFRKSRRLGMAIKSPLDFAVFASFGWLAYWWYVGGDIYYERFLLVLFPLGLFTAARLIVESGPINYRLALLSVAAWSLIVGMPAQNYYLQIARVVTGDGWGKLGKILGKNYPNSRLATEAAGKLAYYSGLETVDVYGLTDEHIAHSMSSTGKFNLAHDKTDLSYVLSRKPNLVAAWINCGLTGPQILQRNLSDFRLLGYQPVLMANPINWCYAKVDGIADDEVTEKITTSKLSFIVLYNPNPSGVAIGEAQIAKL